MIVCDTAKTEPRYFEALRDALSLKQFVDVRVVSKIATDPSEVIYYAAEQRDKLMERREVSTPVDDLNEVWCILDVEQPVRMGLTDALTLARKNDITVILSNPRFEYWYLLHFCKTASSFNSASHVIQKLKKYFPTYSKSSPAIHKEVFQRIESAIKNAEQVIGERKYGADLTLCNPSTHVHRVVSRLRKSADQPVRKRGT